MNSSQLAVQLYTVRDHLLDAPAFARTIERLKAIGYLAVELIPSQAVSDEEVAKICGQAGVKVVAAHFPGHAVLEDPEAIVEKLHVVGADLAIYAYPAGVDMSSRIEVERLAHRLEQSAQALKQAGLTLAYHNHAMEFFRLGNELAFDVLRKNAPTLSVRARCLLGAVRGHKPGAMDSRARRHVSQPSPEGLWGLSQTRRAAFHDGSRTG